MLFNSYIFVLFFLPTVLIGYFSLNHFKCYRLSMLLVLGMSLWFYGYFNYFYLLLMLCSIVFNFGIYKLLSCKNLTLFWRKATLIFALCANIGALFYFKYFDFFIENINAIFKTSWPLQHILLPLGISFFTFQQLSFVVDSYKGEIPDYDFINFACFVSFFPQLVAGPIVTHDELVPQFADISKKAFNWESFTEGLYAFIIGLSKKVLIADVIGNGVNFGYGNISQLNSISAILVCLAYTIQIYFDFSGYSDMAIGLGRMMNITLPTNFNSPYKAITINDFWDRWHMTLTRFFTKYIYIPLGGNRKGAVRTYCNILLVYLISGIWHGSDWTFIFWGICHGVFCIISRYFKNGLGKIPKVINWIITFAFINITWIFFRADSMSDAFAMITRIFFGGFTGVSPQLVDAVTTAEWRFLISQLPGLSSFAIVILLGYIFVPLIGTITTKNISQKLVSFKPSLAKVFVCSVLLVLCIMSFSSVSTFLYFNF